MGRGGGRTPLNVRTTTSAAPSCTNDVGIYLVDVDPRTENGPVAHYRTHKHMFN